MDAKQGALIEWMGLKIKDMIWYGTEVSGEMSILKICKNMTVISQRMEMKQML